MAVTNVMDVQVRLQKDSNVPADAVTNTFHFATVALDDWGTSDFNAAMGMLTNLYTTLGPIMSSSINSGVIDVKFYNQGDPAPRAPQFSGIFNPTGSWGSTAAPDEVALVGSFQGAPLSGTPQARRRGRIYVGPLAAAAGDRPTTTQTNAVKNALQAMATASLAHARIRWVVSSTVSGGFVYVTNGWVDNSWDVQRRRGLKPSIRNTWVG